MIKKFVASLNKDADISQLSLWDQYWTHTPLL
jgi:hypothetical protein